MDKALTESTTAIKEEISDLQQGNVDLNDTPARYLAFFGRLRPIVQPYTRVSPSPCASLLVLTQSDPC